MEELGIRSSDNISKYAKTINAEYRLLRGNVFHKNLASPCQKIYMLNEEFDEYDMVVMLDMDMFVRNGMEEDIFKDVQGIGRHTETQSRLFRSLQRKFPKLTNANFPYWGGAVYRLERKVRKNFRVHIKEDEMIPFSGNYNDEGIMHRLATLSGMEFENPYIPDNRWDCGNFEEGVEQCAMIHVRTKITPVGPKRPKIENYRNLVKRQLITE